MANVKTYEIDRCQTLQGSNDSNGPPVKYRLTRDITGTSSDVCFRIGGHNVILDGNGHAVDGGGQAGIGVLITNQAGGATIENIGLHSFNDYRGAIFVENNAAGETVIRDCNISSQRGGPGIYIRADRSTVQRNYISYNEGTGLGYNAQVSPNHTIENNGFWGNGGNGLSYGAALQSGGLTARNNIAQYNKQHGFSLRQSNLTIAGNTAIENGDSGIITNGNNEIVDNTVGSNSRDGIHIL